MKFFKNATSRLALKSVRKFLAGILSLLIFILIPLEVGLRLRTSVPQLKSESKSLKILFYSDSIGHDLAPLLQSEINGYSDTEIEIVNLARPGMASKEVLNRLEKDIQFWQPKLLLMMIGRADRSNPQLLKKEAIWAQFKVKGLFDYFIQESARNIFSLSFWLPIESFLTKQNCCTFLGNFFEFAGDSVVSTGNQKLVHLYYNLSFNIDPSDAHLRKLAWYYYSVRDLEKVIFYFEQILSKDPNCISCYNAVMTAYSEAQQAPRGHKFFESLLPKTSLKNLVKTYAQNLDIHYEGPAFYPTEPTLSESEDRRAAKQLNTARIEGLIYRNRPEEAKSAFLKSDSSSSFPFLKQTYQNIYDVNKVCNTNQIKHIVLQYPSDKADELIQKLQEKKFMGSIIDTNEFLRKQLRSDVKLSLNDIFENDLDHLRDTGQRILARKLAPLIFDELKKTSNGK